MADRGSILIQDERQREITKRQIVQLKGALKTTADLKCKVPDKFHEAMIAGINSQIQELKSKA